jgi:hypothetical protein
LSLCDLIHSLLFYGRKRRALVPLFAKMALYRTSFEKIITNVTFFQSSENWGQGASAFTAPDFSKGFLNRGWYGNGV